MPGFDLATTIEELAQRIAGFSYLAAEDRIADVFRMTQLLIMDRLGRVFHASPSVVPAQLQALLVDVNRRYREAAALAHEWAGTSARQAFQAGQAVTAQLLRLQGADRLSFSMSSPSLHAVASVTDEMTRDLLSATRRTSEHVKDRVRRVVLEETRSMTATGIRGVDEAQAIADRLAQERIFGVHAKDGSFIPMDEYARTVAHIKLREAQTAGTERMLLDNGFDLVRISTHAHRPDTCSPFEGKVYSITGRTPGYPLLQRHTPYHPGCRHCETPYIETFRSQGEIDRVRAESNATGPIVVYSAEAMQAIQEQQRKRARFLRARRLLRRQDEAAVIAGSRERPSDVARYRKELDRRARARVRALDRQRAAHPRT